MTEIVEERRGAWTAPRTRGMLTGLGLVLLGAWGAVIPFVGPYFHYAYTPDRTWVWTAGRGYLEVLPGAAAFLAGIVLLLAANRALASMAAWMGVAAGAWFAVGPLLVPLWNSADLGSPVGDTRTVAVEQIGFFFGLGAAIVLFAAAAVGRFSLATPVRRTVTEPVAAEPYREPMDARGEPMGARGEPMGSPSGAPTSERMAAEDGAAPEGAPTDRPARPRHSWVPGRRQNLAH